MRILWSPSAGGFFAPETAPADGVELTAPEHLALLAAQAEGRRIETGPGGRPVAVAPAEPSPEEALEAWRATLTCSRAQGIATLGEAHWTAILAHADDPATDWTTRTFIREQQVWSRTSPRLNQLGQLLGLTPEEMDALFVAARDLRI
jgi:hypothetical protein